MRTHARARTPTRRRFGARMAFVQKDRTDAGTSVANVIGDVSGSHVIIYDDMTRSGGTLINAAKAYLDNGASRVTAVLSHFALQVRTRSERTRTHTHTPVQARVHGGLHSHMAMHVH